MNDSSFTLSEKKRLLASLYRDTVPLRESPIQHGYRNKVDIITSTQGIGLKQPGSWDVVVDTTHIPLANNVINAALPLIREWAKTVPLYDLQAKTGFLQLISIRGENDQLQVTLTTRSNEYAEYIQRLYELLRPTSLYWTTTEQTGGSIGEHIQHIYGQKHIRLRVADKYFFIDPYSFFQANTQAAALAINAMRPFVHGRVVDMYCGVGTIGLSLSDDVFGVDIVKQAIELAKKNAQGTSARFVCADAQRFLINFSPDTVIVDPPRTGLQQSVFALVRAAPKTIIYLSCNPQTQVRDLALLSSRYTRVHTEAFDFFPGTHHVEVLVVLRRKD